MYESAPESQKTAKLCLKIIENLSSKFEKSIILEWTHVFNKIFQKIK